MIMRQSPHLTEAHGLGHPPPRGGRKLVRRQCGVESEAPPYPPPLRGRSATRERRRVGGYAAGQVMSRSTDGLAACPPIAPHADGCRDAPLVAPPAQAARWLPVPPTAPAGTVRRRFLLRRGEARHRGRWRAACG